MASNKESIYSVDKPDLQGFVDESWRIEWIVLNEVQRLYFASYCRNWIDRDKVTVATLTDAAMTFTGGKGRLRSRKGMNVKIHDYRPPLGGLNIRHLLNQLLRDAQSKVGDMSPYFLYQHFEQIHPFMDGNGRTGRLLWAWAMEKRGWQYSRGFLHEFHYQSLENFPYRSYV